MENTRVYQPWSAPLLHIDLSEDQIENLLKITDLVLEDKKMKWVFKHAERIGARRLVLLGPDEWSRKMVKIKDLELGKEAEVPLDLISSIHEHPDFTN